MRPIRNLLSAALFTALTPIAASADEAPSVVVSIKPLHSLTAQVMAGVGEPELLVEGRQSPHGFSLRPSQRQAVADADLVVWIGPAIEGFLEKPLEDGTPNLEAMEAPGIALLPYREDHDHGELGHDGHEHEEHEHAHDEHGHDEHGHDENGHHHVGTDDPHIWLDPRNGAALLTAIAARLSEIDPAHADIYRANAEAGQARLAALEADLTVELVPVRSKPYAAFHDAYRYFEERFGLSYGGSITVSPETPPGAKRLSELREDITKDGIACVFSEPQFPPDLVATVIDGTQAKTSTLDPIGWDIPAGPDQYAATLTALADAMADCLK